MFANIVIVNIVLVLSALSNCRVWALERRIFHEVMVNTAKSKHEEMFSFMSQSRKLQSMFNEDQLHALADTLKEEQWKFRFEVDSEQVEGRIYLITSGQVSLFFFFIWFLC